MGITRIAFFENLTLTYITQSLQKEATRFFEGGVISFIQPFLDLSNSTLLSMYACILDISGTIPVGQKVATIGMSKVLSLSVLSFGMHTVSPR